MGNEFNLNIDEYKNSIDEFGMESTWDSILNSFTSKDYVDGILSIPNFGELYEIGLAHVNKDAKKEHGQYFTPRDTSMVMAEWFSRLNGSEVCDVCCGVGKLTLAYLDFIGEEETRKLLESGGLWLYDLDELAMRICVRTIGIIYGREYEEYIHCVIGDITSKYVILPPNAKVITNPPYGRCDGCCESNELYAAVLEKVLDAKVPFVSITPCSFLGADKFQTLREKMNGHGGFVVTFDNSPAMVFHGKKHGVFSSNKVNSTRASIMVCEGEGDGFVCSRMIRFKNIEREELMKCSTLEGFIGDMTQTIDANHPKFAKVDCQLEGLFNRWMVVSKDETLKSHMDGEYPLCFVNTCRTFCVATVKDLARSGKYNLTFRTEDERDLAYAWLNSSFGYWHWRLYDGCIIYHRGLLDGMPTPFNSFSTSTKCRMIELSKEMQAKERDYVKLTKNAGQMQESVVFPKEYRRKLNSIILEELGVYDDLDAFEHILHDSTVFK